MYFAHISIDGPVKYGHLPGPIDVLESLDNTTQIGKASEIAWTDKGLGLWVLTVHGKALPGFWVIIDRQFHPAQ